MRELAAHIADAADVVQSRWGGRPLVGIVLGTGLGTLAEEIQTEATLDYASIPHFPQSTTVGHTGQLVCGMLKGVPVVAMEGRFHSYEGYSQQQITFPIRAMRGPWGRNADRLERLRRHQPALCAGRHRRDRRPYQLDER